MEISILLEYPDKSDAQLVHFAIERSQRFTNLCLYHSLDDFNEQFKALTMEYDLDCEPRSETDGLYESDVLPKNFEKASEIQKVYRMLNEWENDVKQFVLN